MKIKCLFQYVKINERYDYFNCYYVNKIVDSGAYFELYKNNILLGLILKNNNLKLELVNPTDNSREVIYE